MSVCRDTEQLLNISAALMVFIPLGGSVLAAILAAVNTDLGNATAVVVGLTWFFGTMPLTIHALDKHGKCIKEHEHVNQLIIHTPIAPHIEPHPSITILLLPNHPITDIFVGREILVGGKWDG